jgi:phage shock protein E
MRCWELIVALCAAVVMPVAYGADSGPQFDPSRSGQSPSHLSQVAANPAIDVASYLRVSRRALEYRQTHRLSESDFIRMSREPGTVVLDARSREKFDELHVTGAINLSFPDIALGSLRDALPEKNARILIYCNNNFRNAEDPFPSKLPSASLNISTYIALYDYGYRNVYELGPQLDIELSSLEFESTRP